MTVEAGWALWSKKPGSHDDYSVLACSSAPFTRGDFGKIITRFAAGTPDTRSSGPGALPWVTLSWVGVDKGLQLGIAVTEDTGQVDGAGRPITRTSYFCVPYADVAAARLGYSGLYRAVAGIELPESDGPVISLDVYRPADADAVRAVAARFGEREVASAAALLLRGPVSVVRAEGVPLEDRLDFIDAVVSLLPYGYRARFSAGTWADSGARHRLRFTFAARPREDGTAIAWGRPGDIPAGDDVAREYFDQFCSLRGIGRVGGKVFTLPAVLARLAEDAAPRKFEQSPAGSSLFQIDLPFRVERALEAGRPVGLSVLRQVITEKRILELGPGGRAAVLTALSERGEAADWRLLVPWLDDGLDADAVRRILGTFGRRMLWTDRPDAGLMTECLNAAAGPGLVDDVLAVLLVPPDGGGSLSRAVECAADLLAQAAPSYPSGEVAYPRTREALAAEPRVVAGFLAVLADSVPDADRCLRWLEPEAPEALIRLFGIALGLNTDDEIREGDVTQLTYQGASCVTSLLEAAARTGCLDAVLPGCTRWIAGGGLTDADAEELTWYLRNLAAVASPRQRAWLDMALLAAGASPSALPPPMGYPGSQEYVTDLVNIWKHLKTGFNLFDSGRCVGILARYLDGELRTATRQQADAVESLDRQLRTHGIGPVLKPSISPISFLPQKAPAAGPRGSGQQSARALAETPGDTWGPALLSLAKASPGTDPRQLAALCLQACGESATPAEAFRSLAESGAIDSEKTAGDMLAHLADVFTRPRVSGETRNAWLQAYVQAIARGEFGQVPAQGFHQQVMQNAHKSIESGLRQVIALASGTGSGEYELDEADRQWLKNLGDRIDKLHKKTRTKLWKTVRPGRPAQ